MRRIVALGSTILVILLILYVAMLIGDAIYLGLAGLLRLPSSIDMPLPLRFVGITLLAFGVVVILDVLRYRRPLDILISTSDTWAKMIMRRPLGETVRRTEPFIPKGPYVYVRNPMYLVAITLFIGYGLFTSSPPLILSGLIMTIWFWFFQIPFEEKELQALFGESYESYRRQVPKLFPYGKRYKHSKTGD